MSAQESTLGPVTKAIQHCSWFFLTTLRYPPELGRVPAPTPDEVGLFVGAASLVIALAVRIMQVSIPALVAWSRNDSTTFIVTLHEWSEAHAGDQAFARVGIMAAWMALFLMIGALSMTVSLLTLQWRRVTRHQFAEIFARSAIIVSTAIVMIMLSEAIFPTVAQSVVPGWIVFIAFIFTVFIIPFYVVFIIPYLLWRSGYKLGRARAVGVILLGWIMAFEIVNRIPSDYFLPETRVDSLLAAELRNISRLGVEGKYAEAIKLAEQLAPSFGDSIPLDSITISLRSRILMHDIQQRNTMVSPDQNEDGILAINRDYRNLIQLNDRLQIKYSDVPGILLRIARAQLDSGECDKARITFEAVYYHRHAMLMERLFAGLYLRRMNHQPSDFEGLSARFDPANEEAMLRAFFASPGIGIGAVNSHVDNLGQRMLDLEKYSKDISAGPTQMTCDFLPKDKDVHTNSSGPRTAEIRISE